MTGQLRTRLYICFPSCKNNTPETGGGTLDFFLFYIYIFFLDCTIVYIAIASDRGFSRRHGCIVSKDFFYGRDSGHELEAHDAT